MKKAIIYNFIFLLLVSVSCSDYLEEDNPGAIVGDEYYTTAQGFESLVNANYSSLRQLYGQEAYVYTLGTDLFTSGRGNPPAVGLLNYHDLTAADINGTQYVRDLYRDAYSAIQLANNALYYKDITEQTSRLEMREGEIRFLRAFYYFILVQQFGDVPMVTERISEPQLSFPREPASEVYAFIISEMEEALNLVAETAEEPGRVDQRVVRHYLSKVYLTRGYESYAGPNDFELAAEYAEEAIAGQGLNLSFEEVFEPGNEENEEIIFAVQYDPSTMQNLAEDGHRQNYWYGPYFGGEGALYGYPNRHYGLVPSLYAFEIFRENGQYDERWEGTFMTTLYESELEDGRVGTGYYQFYTEGENRENLPVRIYFAHEWVNVEEWRAENPNRRDAEVRPFSQEWEASQNTQLDAATPAIRKFDDPTSVFSSNGSSTRDIFLARLAETYLNAAEAYFQMGNTAKAAEYINIVRRRAAKPGAQSEMEISAADVDIDFILDERARELMGEYHRWFDLKRTGMLVRRNLLYNREVRRAGNPFGDGNQKVLRPIPQSVINLNEALGPQDQNPGY